MIRTPVAWNILSIMSASVNLLSWRVHCKELEISRGYL